MSMKARTRGMFATAVVVALAVTAFAAASQAQASTLYACVKKNGTARIYSKKPKCKKGESKLSWNTTGPAGKNGANGSNGSNGSAGTNGAVAGYGAVQSSELNITPDEGFTQLPGLTKALPAGSFIASGRVNIFAVSEKKGEFAGAECELVDTPASGSGVAQAGFWEATTGTILFFNVAAGDISFDLPITTTVSSTLAVKCKEDGHNEGAGEEVTISAADGSLVAVQTSGNS